MYVAKEEPEFMRKWKEEQKERLEKKDQEETAAMEELKVKAKQELEDWYKRYETQIEKTKSSNREEETKYEGNEMNHIEPGSEWERVAKHCDFSAKVRRETECYLRLKKLINLSTSIIFNMEIIGLISLKFIDSENSPKFE